MPFTVLKDDIFYAKAKSLVNPVYREPVIRCGLDMEINEKSGGKIFKEREKIGYINLGEAIITKAYDLNFDYIIHTAIPNIYSKNPENIIRLCYRNSLKLAKKYNLNSIAIPLLGTDLCEFSKKKMIDAARDEIEKFLSEDDMDVYLFIDEKNRSLISKKVKSFIKKRYLPEFEIEEDRVEVSNDFLETKCLECVGVSLLDEKFFDERMENTFSEELLKIIKSKNLKPSDVYKKANIDRKHFSKIKNDKNYQPSKITAIAFALALNMDMDEAEEFISKAGYAFTRSSKFDIIIEYCIKNKIYNIFDVNEILYSFNQQLIGCLL